MKLRRGGEGVGPHEGLAILVPRILKEHLQRPFWTLLGERESKEANEMPLERGWLFLSHNTHSACRKSWVSRQSNKDIVPHHREAPTSPVPPSIPHHFRTLHDFSLPTAVMAGICVCPHLFQASPSYTKLIRNSRRPFPLPPSSPTPLVLEYTTSSAAPSTPSSSTSSPSLPTPPLAQPLPSTRSTALRVLISLSRSMRSGNGLTRRRGRSRRR